MKNLFYLIVFLMVMLPSGLSARVKLAVWNFNHTYEQVVVNDSTVYTPTTKALTADPNLTIPTQKFKIYPDSSLGIASLYVYNASSTYCQLKTGYNNYMSRIMFAGPSSVGDISLGTNHKNYFQFSFPTIGYDSIKINFSISGGQNLVDDFVRLVYSTDGGSSWVDAGNYNMLSGWWLYQEYTVAISARNKENVLLRLIANTASSSGTANFNLDYFRISGTEYTGSQVVNTSSTITWPFNTGASGQAATYSAGSETYFGANWVANGSNLTYKAANINYDITYTQFQPGAQSNTYTENDLVSFNVRPKTGLSFTPTSISFDCMRYGTDGGSIDVIWKSTDGTLTTLATAVKPARNNSGAGTHASYDLTSLSVPESNGDCALYIYIYALGNTKQVGLANIIINGKLTGSMAEVNSYKLNASVSPAGAGNLTTFPVGNEFDEGTKVTLTAATRNFGYQFKEWQDENGKVLSSVSPYTFTITSNTTIKAIYEPLVTYNFTVNILGSQWGKVALSPAPTDGKYEAGTTVLMTITPNPITQFSFWDDNTTATSRTVSVDGDKSFSASFDEIPFIVGWNFNPTTPNSARAGDFYSESSNTGVLNVYNQDGSATSWLAHAGAFSPVSPCAYLWTPAASFASNRRCFVASFSTIGFTNIQVKSQMAGSYQHYQTQKMQVSLDGTSFTDLASVNLNNAWSDLNATLSSEYEGKEKVYIRWIADTNSTLAGDATGNDGTALTNIFVFADKSAVNDTTPPVLVSTVPAEGAANASANGSIVLTFNEKMKAGTGNCTLGDAVLTPTFGSKTVTFTYTRLSYNSAYTFTVPAGALTDAAGNQHDGVTLHFKTVNRPVPVPKLFDAVVARDGSGDFTSIQAAINAVPNNRALPYLIFVKNGTYTGHVDIPANKPFIHLIGQLRDSVIISDARLCGKSNTYPDSTVYHVSQGASVVVNSSNCYFENITFENKFGYDNLSGPQALALYTIGDRIVLNNCWLRSYQDTYLSTYGNVAYRHYLRNCCIEGAVDFIYGGGDVFFDQCTIFCNRESGGYIVAPSHQTGTKWGYVFSSCTIDGTKPSYTTYFGRPWANAPKASFFNTKAKIKIYPVGWYYKMGTIPAVFADYNTMDGNGNLTDMSQRISDYEYDVKDANGNLINTVKGKAKNSFTDLEAAQFTYENVTSGSDGWDPRAQTEACEAPVVTINKNTLSWKAIDYAICYVILRDSKVLGFSTQNSFTDTTQVNGKSYTYQVLSANESGSLSALSNSVTGGKEVAVSETMKEKPVVFTQHSTLRIKNILPGTKIVMYSVDGNIVFKDISSCEAYSKNFFGIKGIYIVTLNNNSYKLVFN